MNVPFLALTFLFFAWGFITCLNDILMPHLRSAFLLTYAQAALVQSAFFLAYFFSSLPSGAIVGRVGYKNGIVIGLAVMAFGSMIFMPAAAYKDFSLFLLALFVLGSGIALLQVAANPFVTLLGKPETASSRLNLTQAFNSLGTTVAPAVGGSLLLSTSSTSVDSVGSLYVILGSILLGLAGLFAAIKLPRPTQPANEPLNLKSIKSALHYRNLKLGVVAIFVYVGAEVAIGSFLVDYITKTLHITASEAAYYVSFYWGGSMIGRFVGSGLMRYLSPGRLLTAAACCSVVLIAASMLTTGNLSVYALLAVGLCNSIMFPTIFSLGIQNLGPHTSVGSSIMIMAIVGGAVVPLLTGILADQFTLGVALLLPMLCYFYIGYFGLQNDSASAPS